MREIRLSRPYCCLISHYEHLRRNISTIRTITLLYGDLAKIVPTFREFQGQSQKPTHMGSSYPNPNCAKYPPPPRAIYTLLGFGGLAVATYRLEALAALHET